MYTYPEALDAMEKIATDLFAAANKPHKVTVMPDATTGTASVSWGKDYNGKFIATIRMPVLPAHHKISKAAFDDYAGYVFHEVGHPLFTDQQVWTWACQDGYANLLNALEDVRIEKALIDAKIAANGQAVLTSLCHSLDYTAIQKGFDANDPRNIGFVMSFLGRAANGYALDTRLLKLNSGSAVSKALVWALPELKACASTNDCLDLAKKLLKALPKKEPKAPKGNPGKTGQKAKSEPMEAQKGEGEPTEVQKAKSEPTEAQKGEGEPTEDQKAKGEPTEAQKGEGEPTEAQKGEGEDGAQGGSGSANGASAYTEALSDKDVRPVNLRPTDKSELKDRRGKGEQHASDMAAVIAAIRGADKSKGQAIPASTPSSTVLMTETMAAAAARSGRQRTLLARALKRNELDLFEGGLKHGKLDRRAFARLAAGAPNVFGRRELTEGYETDAVVLVDGSASMEGERINSASTMALVIAQAAAQVGVSCTTYLFGASHYHYRSANGLFEVNGGRQKPQASQFAGIPMMGGGGTPLSASMLAVALRQAMAAPYKRRVMFVVSDGMCDDGPESLKAVATYVETALGTELAHMSIHMRPQACFRNEVHVPRGSDIAAIGLETLTAKLAKGF